MTKIPELLWELSIVATGIDEPSTTAWYWTYIQQNASLEPEVRDAIMRACDHWAACDEATKSAIGPFFGLGEPHKEHWPSLQVIKADYEVALSVTIQVLAEEY